MRPRVHSSLAFAFLLAAACTSPAPPGFGLGEPDAGSGSGGGGGGEGVTPACSNGIDDDNDGLIDGFDPECTGPADNREDSFATGIPGDNIDAVKQDCFFDGDSGHGNDGCLMHTCCLLEGECPEELRPDQFDPTECQASQDCIDFCAPLTPPGCDCFGCCTICDGDQCRDVLTNPAVAPNCTLDRLADETACPACVKVADCGPGDCDNSNCELCPGQLPEDLPPECDGNYCSNGAPACVTTEDCGPDRFCSVGCCIAVID